MQSTDSPDKIILPFAELGVKQTIPLESQISISAGRASYQDGFPPATRTPIAAGGIPPYGTDFNGLFYVITNLLRWQNSGGTYTFDQTLSDEIEGYPAGAVLQMADASGLWFNTAEDNTTDPDSDDAEGWIAMNSDSSILISETINAAPEAANVSEALLEISARLIQAEEDIPVVRDATTVQKGIVRYATVPQHVAGTANNLSTTPQGVAAMIADRIFAFITLIGPTLIFPGSSNTYTITNYSDFSTYTVSASEGSASITGDTITVDIGGGVTVNEMTLTVTRDGSTNTFTIAVGEQSIATPSITYPSAGDTNIALSPVIESSAFQTYPPGADTHVSTDWQISSDAGFATILASSIDDTTNLTEWTPSSPLPYGTPLYVRVRYQGDTLGETDWSTGVAFTTVSQYIEKPAITSPTDGATGIQDEPTITASAFTTSPANIDNHEATNWRLYDGTNTVIWESLNDTANRTSITIPEGVLSEGEQTYEIEVQYIGETLPESEYSNRSSFVTADVFEFIATPSITAPTDGATDQPEQPILESSAFSVTPSGADTHVSSSWRVKDGGGTVIWESLNNTTDLLSITIPAGELTESTTYTAEVRHEGSTLISDWSAESSFTTEAQFLPDQPGQPFGGGYFTREMIDPLGNPYFLIVSPRAEGSDDDGNGNRGYAVNYADGLTIGGFTDWKLPDIDELIVLYRAFKPTEQSSTTNAGATDRVEPPLGNYTSGDPAQTSIVEFQTGGSEAFNPTIYWSESQSGTDSFALGFNNGGENGGSATLIRSIRAVRLHYEEPPIVPGTEYGGGYSVRRMIDEVGDEYVLVVSPKAEGGNNDIQLAWQPAMDYAASLTIGGFTDWKLPDRDEMSALYRAFKPSTASNNTSYGASNRVQPPLGNYTSGDPAQTALTEFQSGGSEAFGTVTHWSATTFDSANSFTASFNNGAQLTTDNTSVSRARAVRRVYI